MFAFANINLQQSKLADIAASLLLFIYSIVSSHFIESLKTYITTTEYNYDMIFTSTNYYQICLCTTRIQPYLYNLVINTVIFTKFCNISY